MQNLSIASSGIRNLKVSRHHMASLVRKGLTEECLFLELKETLIYFGLVPAQYSHYALILFTFQEKMLKFWINTFFTDMHIMQQHAAKHAVESE